MCMSLLRGMYGSPSIRGSDLLAKGHHILGSPSIRGGDLLAKGHHMCKNLKTFDGTASPCYMTGMYGSPSIRGSDMGCRISLIQNDPFSFKI